MLRLVVPPPIHHHLNLLHPLHPAIGWIPHSRYSTAPMRASLQHRQVLNSPRLQQSRLCQTRCSGECPLCCCHSQPDLTTRQSIQRLCLRHHRGRASSPSVQNRLSPQHGRTAFQEGRSQVFSQRFDIVSWGQKTSRRGVRQSSSNTMGL